MTKNEYVQLRSSLNFKLKHLWLLSHLVVDAVLVGLPYLMLRNEIQNLGLNWESIGRCTLSALCLSVLYFRSFSMMHEGVHGLLAKWRRANDLLGLVYGAICFLPFVQWREIHLLHHYWSGNIEKDPVRKITVLFHQKPTFMTQMMSFFWPTWFPAAAIMQNYVFWSECLIRFDRKKGGPLAIACIVVPILLWGSIFALAGVKLSLVMIIPSILIYLALVEMVNFPHHTDLPQATGDTRFALWDQHKTARSCFYPKLFERFVLLNFNYHIEHHMFPTLPWYELEKLSTGLRQQIPDYFYSNGNEWVIRSRKRPFKDVCLSQNEGSGNETTKAA